jgi:hypothetical protein
LPRYSLVYDIKPQKRGVMEAVLGEELVGVGGQARFECGDLVPISFQIPVMVGVNEEFHGVTS